MLCFAPQVADVLGLFDMGSFNFDTPPEDYSDVTPGFLLNIGDVTGPTLQSVEVRVFPSHRCCCCCCHK